MVSSSDASCSRKRGVSWKLLEVYSGNRVQAWFREGESGKSCWTTHFEMADDAHSSSVHYTSCFLNYAAISYVMWQKSNETDFLLTMNFIHFTNQGYPLQNSSLGQLHSDGGVVSIVRSSARKLLLVYLSARRLRSSGYYPKYQNGALSSSF